jgi:hypothetical protein
MHEYTYFKYFLYSYHRTCQPQSAAWIEHPGAFLSCELPIETTTPLYRDPVKITFGF